MYARHTNQDHVHAVWKITSEAIDQLHRSLESCPGETAVAEDPAGLKVSQGRLPVQSPTTVLQQPHETAAETLSEIPFLQIDA